MSRRRYERDPQQKKQPPRGCYDVAMIRDFIAQLVTELRVNNYEQTVQPHVVNPELAEEMARWVEKRGTYLTARNLIEGDSELSMEEFQKAAAFYRAYRHRETEEQILQLEALQDLFEEAFFCAERPGQQITNHVNAREWLDMLNERDPPETEEGGRDDTPRIPRV
jgi:hypothetical protein